MCGDSKLLTNLSMYILKASLIIVFADTEPVVHEETGPSEANLFSGKRIIDPNQAPKKQVKPVTRLHKILRFRLCPDDADSQDATSDQTP